jgi:hypothetical protein
MFLISLAHPGHVIATWFAWSAETLPAIETGLPAGFDILAATTVPCQEDEPSPDTNLSRYHELPFSTILPRAPSVKINLAMAIS